MNKTIEQLLSHRSIRKFTNQDIPQSTLETLIACGQAAATSSNVQAVTVVQVTDTNKRERMVELSGGQSYVASSGAFLVYCADMNRSKWACEHQGGHYAAGMTEQFIIATVDVALFAQNTVIAAESLGLGICYIGGLRNNPQQVAELLELPDYVYPVFGLCLGYPDQNPEVKPRLPLEAVLMTNRYDSSPFPESISSYDQTLGHYYKSRTGNNKNSSWSDAMKTLVGKESRPHMQAFLKQRGFLQK